MQVTPSVLGFVLALAPGCGAQDTQQSVATLLGTLKKEGVTVDLEARTVAVDAFVNRPGDLLEYVLIHRRGKGHEALLVTEVRPSVLNAGLLALGLTPGKNADFKPRNPLPTPEEAAAGAPTVDVIPPQGTQLWLTVAWSDDAGKRHELPIEDLLIDLHTQRPVVDASFLYLGGRMAPLQRGQPPVFVADYEGNLISCCYLLPENHLVTMRHERAPSDQNWWIDDRCPPPGTAVRVTLHLRMPKLLAGRDQRLKEQSAKEAASRPTAPESRPQKDGR
jgi:hypothetical protein